MAPRRKTTKAKKLTEPVSFDTKDISTAIDSITVSAEKVSVMFSSQEKYMIILLLEICQNL